MAPFLVASTIVLTHGHEQVWSLSQLCLHRGEGTSDSILPRVEETMLGKKCITSRSKLLCAGQPEALVWFDTKDLNLAFIVVRLIFKIAISSEVLYHHSGMGRPNPVPSNRRSKFYLRIRSASF